MAGVFKNLDASDIRLTPFRAYKRYSGADFYTTYSAFLNTKVVDRQEDIGNEAYYNSEFVTLTTNDKSSNSVWHSINSQFYRYYYSNPKAAFGGLSHLYQPRYLSDKAMVISIPQRYSGEGIEPTSVTLQVKGETYLDDVYGNLVPSPYRWGSELGNELISASNVVFALKPAIYTEHFGKTITYTEPCSTDLYQASVQLTNVFVTCSTYETHLQVNPTIHETSSIVIKPNGPEVNQLFNFQNKDYTITINAGAIAGTGPILEKKQQVEVTQVDINGIVNTQKVYRYPYAISITSAKKIRFRKSDGKTTLTYTTTDDYDASYPIILARSGSTFTLKNGVTGNNFNDTLYDKERYCINNADIYIGANQDNEAVNRINVGNVVFYNYRPTSLESFDVLFRNNTEGNPYATVGNVFRQHGLVVVTSKKLVADILDQGIDSIEYRGTTTIYENEISCTVGPGEFAVSYNPTTHEYDPTIDEYKIAASFTGSDFRPFVSRIGLYNDNNELVVVGSLSQPIQLPNNVDTTFIVRYDL